MSSAAKMGRADLSTLYGNTFRLTNKDFTVDHEDLILDLLKHSQLTGASVLH